MPQVMAAADTADRVHLYDVGSSAPKLGSAQAEYPPPLLPKLVLYHEFQRQVQLTARWEGPGKKVRLPGEGEEGGGTQAKEAGRAREAQVEVVNVELKRLYLFESVVRDGGKVHGEGDENKMLMEERKRKRRRMGSMRREGRMF